LGVDVDLDVGPLLRDGVPKRDEERDAEGLHQLLPGARNTHIERTA